MRLLILKCSARKRGDDTPVATIERYAGPLWQVLRSYLRAQLLFAADLRVYGLSAKYGLIPGTHPIPPYDETMDLDRADTLRPPVLTTFQALMGTTYDRLCLGSAPAICAQ